MIAGEETRIGVFFPSLWFYGKYFFVGAVVIKISISFGHIMFKQIISYHESKSMKIFLLGYGLLIPLCWIVPFLLIDIFQIKNVVHANLGAMLIAINSLKYSETISGFHPKNSEKSFIKFLRNTSFFMVATDEDGEPIKMSPSEKQNRLKRNLVRYFFLCIIMSVLLQKNFVLFSKPKSEIDFKENCVAQDFICITNIFWRLFDLRHLANNFIMAFLANMTLGVSADMAGMANVLRGIKLKDVTMNPMLESTSPSDFWGRRWNRLIHATLKGGVYKPVRSLTNSATAATFAVFIVSGIIHEFILGLFAYASSIEKTDSSRDWLSLWSFGNQTLFFLWNAVIILIELSIGHMFVFQWIKNNLPKGTIGILVVLSALPVGHLFTDEYVKLGFYEDFSLGLFIFKKI